MISTKFYKIFNKHFSQFLIIECLFIQTSFQIVGTMIGIIIIPYRLSGGLFYVVCSGQAGLSVITLLTLFFLHHSMAGILLTVHRLSGKR